MKKLLVLFAVAAALVAVSCTQENLETVKAGQEVNVTFRAQLPSQIATKAYSDGSLATKLVYAVYNANSKEPLYDDEAEFVNGEAVIDDLVLITGKTYNLLFWAQSPDNETYAVSLKDQTMTVDYTKMLANDENNDAFYAFETFTVKGALNETVELYRPFAQVNVGTDDIDKSQDKSFKLEKTSMKARVANVLNFADGTVSGEADVEYAVNDVPSALTENFPISGYDTYLSMNYLLVGSAKTTTNCEFYVYSEGNDKATNHITVPNVPVQRNYRTNIYGSLLTDPSNFKVVIEEAFAGEDTNLNLTNVSSELEFVNAMANGTSVKLMNDIALSEDVSVKIAKGTGATIDLNGHTLSAVSTVTGKNSQIFDVQGTLNVKGGTVEQTHTGENMGWNNCTYNFYVSNGGVLNLEDIVVNNLGGTDMNFCVHLNNWGEVTLNADNCEFNSTYCGVRVFNSGPQMNYVTIKNSKLTGAARAFWVHNYIGDGNCNDSTLDIDIFNNNNTFELSSSTTIAPIRYGAGNAVYYTAEGVRVVGAGTEEALKAALGSEDEEIVIALTADVTLGDDFVYIGGNDPKSVIIKGAGDDVKLTFTNSYMAQVKLKNKNTTLYLENLVVEDTRPSGTRDLYDINFSGGNVVMNDVEFTKSVLISGGCKAVMNNVTITESNNEAYALWLCAGVDVTLNNCSINGTAAGARAIKIADESVADIQLTKLSVSNTSFVSNKKAAILVTSTAGAAITLDNINIEGVAADNTNAVWVDEVRAAYADLVTVTGGTKILEP